MPTTYSVVLQMPRGNTETIFPRALVLAAIRRFIEAERYDEAFLACRNQRVDMNILHDHDPERFLRNIEKIVKQIKKVEHIDLLLSQLRQAAIFSFLHPVLTPLETKMCPRRCTGKLSRQRISHPRANFLQNKCSQKSTAYAMLSCQYSNKHYTSRVICRISSPRTYAKYLPIWKQD